MTIEEAWTDHPLWRYSIRIFLIGFSETKKTSQAEPSGNIGGVKGRGRPRPRRASTPTGARARWVPSARRPVLWYFCRGCLARKNPLPVPPLSRSHNRRGTPQRDVERSRTPSANYPRIPKRTHRFGQHLGKWKKENWGLFYQPPKNLTWTTLFLGFADYLSSAGLLNQREHVQPNAHGLP